MRLRHIIALLLLGLTLVASEAAGANRLLLRRLPADKGWPEGEVNSIVRDAEGCVWIGTAEGLTCYDGQRCHTYPIEGRRTDGQDNSIHRLMLDSQGRLWMKAGQEYLYFDRRRKAFARNVEGLWRTLGWAQGPDQLATDAQGNLFAAMDGEGLYALTSLRPQAHNASPQRPRTPQSSSASQHPRTPQPSSTPQHPRSLHSPQWPYPDELKGLQATDLTAEGDRLWVAFSDGTVACCDPGAVRQWTVCRQIGTQLADEINEPIREEVKLLADLQGDLWAYCIYGVWHYDAWEKAMACVTRTREGDFVRVMAQDAMHRIWVGRDKSGLSVLEKSSGQEERLWHDPSDSRSLPGNTITALACSPDSAVIIGTYKGGMALYHPHLYLFDKEVEGEVSALTESPQGLIAIGSGQDIIHWEDAGDKGLGIRDKGLGIRDKGYIDRDKGLGIRDKGYIDRDKGLGIRDKVNVAGDKETQLNVSESIVCMLYGRDSTLWVGTFRGGLTAFHGEQQRSYRHTMQGIPHQPSASSQQPSASPHQASASSQQPSASPYEPSATSQQDFSLGLANDNVWALAEDSCGAIWIATLGGGLQRYMPAADEWSPTRSTGGSTRSTGSTGGSTGSSAGQWTTFSRAQGGLADDYLSSLSPSRRGGLWIGMASRGFAFISFDSLRITNYSGTLRGNQRLHSPYINQLCEDSRGWLWLATRNGVEIYLPDEDQLLTLPLPPGCTTFAAAVAEDHEGAMWIALGRELLRVEADRREHRFHTRLYGQEEGLTAGVLNQRALCSLSDGRMAAGGTEGLCTFYPQVMKSHYTLRATPPRGMTQGGVILTVALLLLATLAAGAIAWTASQRRQQRRRRARTSSQRLSEGSQHRTTDPKQHPVADGSQQHPVADGSQPQGLIVPHLSEPEVESLDEQFVARATCYVEANMQRSELSVEELSQELAMSRGHLYKRLTQLTGMTPLEFIRTIRLQRAALLLKRSGMSVAEVAYAVGFNNPKYFSRYFKESYGVLPSAYRNTPDEGQATENITSDNPRGDN